MTDDSPSESPTACGQETEKGAKRRILTWLSELARTLARACSFTALLITLLAFLFDPQPWHSPHSLAKLLESPEKLLALLIIFLGAYGARIALAFCLLACCLIPWARSAKRRPLWPAFVASAISYGVMRMVLGQ